MSMTWWVISDRSMLEALRRCEAGESAELVHLELYANSEVETVSEGDGE